MPAITAPLAEWLLEQGLDTRYIDLVTMATKVALVVGAAIAADIVARRVVVRGLEKLVGRTATRWDDIVVRRRVFHRLSHLAPALLVYVLAPQILTDYPAVLVIIRRTCLVYMLLVTALVIDGVLSATAEILRLSRSSRDFPVKSIVQILKLTVYIVATIGGISLVVGRSPALLLSGLGAMTAVLLLVFRDPLMGLVAGIQLSANRMVARGDWIEMPKFGADGNVLEVALTTVKVQNWDKTITTIPTSALITESFKNWRGMTESPGRRIKRAIHIDIASICFCDQDMLDRFGRIQYISEYLDSKRQEIAQWNASRKIDAGDPLNSRQLTNVGTFRAYIVAFLRHHPSVHQEMTLLVRQLAPTPEGLPIEVYVFSRRQQWDQYEDVQADIFDHILAVAPAFDLRVYQNLAGSDVRHAMGK